MSKYRLNNPDLVPAGGWRYEDPSNGVIIKGGSLSQLSKRVGLDRLKRGVPAGDVLGDITDYLCSIQQPGSKLCSFFNEDKVTGPRRKYNIEDVKSYLKAITTTVKKGVVTQEEANRRAGICTMCHHNKQLPGCTGCSNISDAVFKVIGAKTTPMDPNLKECGICGCSLKAKVWVLDEGIVSAPNVTENKDLFPDHCWVGALIK